VTENEWRQTFYTGVPDNDTNAKRTAYNRAKNDLLAKEVIVAMNEFVWFRTKADEPVQTGTAAPSSDCTGASDEPKSANAVTETNWDENPIPEHHSTN
jgi:hypothetical protein